MGTRVNENLCLMTLLLIVASGCSTASGPAARSGSGETRLGKIEFESDYVTEATAAKLREELKFQAAVQTFLWSFPLASVMSLRDGHRAVGSAPAPYARIRPHTSAPHSSTSDSSASTSAEVVRGLMKHGRIANRPPISVPDGATRPRSCMQRSSSRLSASSSASRSAPAGASSGT